MSLYKLLLDFRDDKIDAKSVNYEDRDDSLKIRTVSSKNRGKSLVEIYFYDSDDYFKLFVDEDDHNNNVYLLNVALGRGYYDYVFMDSYSTDDEFRYGAINYLNDDNLKKLKNCIKLVNPSFDFSIHTEELANEFMRLFEDDANDIGNDYLGLYDEALIEGLRQYISKRVCNVLQDFGIFETSCGKKYYSTVNQIIKIIENSGEFEADGFITILKKLIEKNNLIIDEDLFDDYYSYFDLNNFDEESFNRNAERVLDRVEEKIMEEIEEGTLQENIKIMNFLEKRDMKVGIWYKFPSEKSFGKEYNKILRVDKVNDGEITITVKMKDGSKDWETYAITLDEFIKFLFNPELFD